MTSTGYHRPGMMTRLAAAMRGEVAASTVEAYRRASAVAYQDMMAAEADRVVSFGESLWSPDADGQVHERVENSLRRGIVSYYELGQLLAMPALLDRPEITATPVSGHPLPLPGQPGFDPWCLTDPHSRTSWQQDPAARRAIETLWRYDPDPAATLAIQSQIDAAVAAGSAVAGTSRGQRHYHCCPWSAIYLARQPIAIDGHRLRPMQEFTFDVSAEEMAEGGQFTRRLLTGPFHPTSEIDYCDPAAGGE